VAAFLYVYLKLFTNTPGSGISAARVGVGSLADSDIRKTVIVSCTTKPKRAFQVCPHSHLGCGDGGAMELRPMTTATRTAFFNFFFGIVTRPRCGGVSDCVIRPMII
jgi:hypothetical protein